jgi:hypothetical protein
MENIGIVLCTFVEEVYPNTHTAGLYIEKADYPNLRGQWMYGADRNDCITKLSKQLNFMGLTGSLRIK